jgi:hypothetical protein
MDQKTNKVFLPTSYEQFLQQKKKVVKPIASIKPTTISHEFQKENRVNNMSEKDEYDDDIK